MSIAVLPDFMVWAALPRWHFPVVQVPDYEDKAKLQSVEGQLAAATRWLQVVNHALERCRARNPLLELRGP